MKEKGKAVILTILRSNYRQKILTNPWLYHEGLTKCRRAIKTECESSVLIFKEALQQQQQQQKQTSSSVSSNPVLCAKLLG